jgi:hypothetical protein
LVHDNEEATDDGTSDSIWVQLTNTRNQHCPRHTSEECVDIRVNSST